MRRQLLAPMVAAAVLSWSCLSIANDGVMKLTKDPNNWAIWGGDYA